MQNYSSAFCCGICSAFTNNMLKQKQWDRWSVCSVFTTNSSSRNSETADQFVLSSLPTAEAETVVTADQGVRGGRIIQLKKTVDAAMVQCSCIKRVFVYQRTGGDVPMGSKDILMQKVKEYCTVTAIRFCCCVFSLGVRPHSHYPNLDLFKLYKINIYI